MQAVLDHAAAINAVMSRSREATNGEQSLEYT